MNSQKTLLLDLDGVLIDMVVPLMRWWGVSIDHEEQYPQQFGGDVQAAIVHLHEQQNQMVKANNVRNMPKEVFWHRPSRGFWRNLRPYLAARDFVEFLETGPFDIYFMTAHANPDCAAAKLDWIDERFPKYRDRVLVGHPKHLVANSHSILIDDCTKNCEDFIKAGGVAIQCPRPWNTRHNAPEYFNEFTGQRRPEYNVITQDLYAIIGTP